MIDDKAAKELAKLHPRSKKPYCLFDGDRALVHSPMLVLDLQKDDVSAVDWPGKPIEGVRQWKYKYVPQNEEGEVARYMRTTWVDDTGEETEVVKLVSENRTGFLDAKVFDFVFEQIDGVEFRLYGGATKNGSPYPVALYRAGKPVGVIAQIAKPELIDDHDDWDTF